jgi:serine/threonine protein kinase/tetratricopeptide (TPR) repeat protein
MDANIPGEPLPAGVHERPLESEPSEATFVYPNFLRGTGRPQLDTDRELPATAPSSPASPGTPAAMASSPPPGDPLSATFTDLAADALAEALADAPAATFVDLSAGALAEALALADAPAATFTDLPASALADAPADPLAPAPGAAFSPPSAESLPPPAESLAPSHVGPVGAAFVSAPAGPALFSQAMPVQALLSRPASAALPMTGAHPAFGFPGGGDNPGPEPVLLPGSIVGRYAIHSHVSTRGAGALYRAHDPRLGRDVALQVWRASSYLPAAASPAGMRFLLQARTLAQLSHPHVLALLDVGAVGPSVFVAMETFQGVPLDRWLAGAPRKLARILDVFVKAGRGLAAAHGAGLLHRDFQPAHVLVGKGNDVRVVDFGLTAALAPAPGATHARTDLGADPAMAPGAALPRRAASSITDLELGEFGRDEAATEIDISVRDAPPTEIDMDPDRVFRQVHGDTERRAGDPAPPPPSPYAAPEQHAGGPATARSDQFSFCAVLYEALCGVKPFAGDTAAALLDSIRAGQLSPPDPGHASRIDVPTWLQAVLLRGLAAAPEARYESMDALLAELDAGRTRRRRQLRWAAIIAGALGSFAVGAAYATMDDDPCETAAARLGAVWNDQVIQSMASAFAATGAADAEGAHARVAGVLDDYARSWSDMHANACADAGTGDARAARPKTEPTTEPMTEAAIEAERADRLQCLSDRLRSLQALTGALTTDVDRAVVENAVAAAARLPSIEACASAAGRRAPAPEDERAQAELATLQAELAAAATQVDLGRHEGLAAQARALLGRAEDIEHAPGQARAHRLLARLQSAAAEHGQAEVSLRQALRLAEQGQDDDLAAELWVDLVESIGLAQGRHDEARAARPAAEAAVARARAPDVHRAALFGRMAVVLGHLGQDDEARALGERALGLVAKTSGPDSVNELEPLEALGQALQLQGRHRDAVAPLQRALTLTERYFGRAHVRQVPALMHLGASHLALGQPESALERFAQARDIEEAYHGPRSARMAEIATEMGRALCRQGKHEQAVAPLERAVEIGTELHGAEHPRITPALLVRAELEAARGEHEQARQVLERVLAIRERRLGAEHPDAAGVRARLGHVLVELGDRERAQALLEDALAALERAHGENHLALAPALSGLGALWREHRSEKRARRFLERLVGILRQHLGEDHPAVAAADAELGEALLVLERAAAARPAFERARDVLEAEGRAPTPVLARVLTGLAECELAADAPEQAVPLLERALTVHGELPGDPVHLARTRFALARALWAGRADRTRALTFGQQAEQALAGLGPRASRELEAVREWLESDRP